jgi:hypothetical protein
MEEDDGSSRIYTGSSVTESSENKYVDSAYHTGKLLKTHSRWESKGFGLRLISREQRKGKGG